MGTFCRNIIVTALLAVCFVFVASGAYAGEESGVQDTNEEVRFLTWYILLSDSATAEIQGFVQIEVSFAFLLSNHYGSPTADGHYEGKSCYTWVTNYDSALHLHCSDQGFDFF